LENSVILAQYKPIEEYDPQFGDIVFRAGWINSDVGIVNNYDKNKGELYIIFSSLPLLLLTMPVEEQVKRTEIVKLGVIKNATKGKWAFQQHSKAHNTTIWYI
jgi:hypothetical protein